MPILNTEMALHQELTTRTERHVMKMLGPAEGISFRKGHSLSFPCTPCIKGKGHFLPFIKSKTIHSKPGEVLHMDVWGPMDIVITPEDMRFMAELMWKHG
jgi:hypothetical protein